MTSRAPGRLPAWRAWASRAALRSAAWSIAAGVCCALSVTDAVAQAAQGRGRTSQAAASDIHVLKVRDNVFRRWREPWLGLRDYRAWAALLFFVTVVLWWSFR